MLSTGPSSYDSFCAYGWLDGEEVVLVAVE